MPRGRHSNEKSPKFRIEDQETKWNLNYKEIDKQLAEVAKHYRPVKMWISEEEELLRKYYNKVPLTTLERLLHHSVTSISDKAFRMKLKRSR